MNNEQKTVSVPRELLVRVSMELVTEDDYHKRIKAREELRALLDAPAEGFNPKGWSIDHTAGRPILTYNNCSVIEAEQAYGLLELIKTAGQPQGEPVARSGKSTPDLWQVRFFHGENTCTPGWEAWENLTVKYQYAGETIESRVREIQGYIAQGYKYELRALYAEQPAPVEVRPV